MRFSLQTRELIADSIETVSYPNFPIIFPTSVVSQVFDLAVMPQQQIGRETKILHFQAILIPFLQVTCAQHHDANISIPGCDKNMPG